MCKLVKFSKILMEKYKTLNFFRELLYINVATLEMVVSALECYLHTALHRRVDLVLHHPSCVKKLA